MTDAAYVVTGWVLTAVVLAVYCASIARRTRRARRSLRPGQTPPP
jgi:heme exporter protein CcmD